MPKYTHGGMGRHSVLNILVSYIFSQLTVDLFANYTPSNFSVLADAFFSAIDDDLCHSNVLLKLWKLSKWFAL